MATSWGGKCLKIFLTIFNIIFFLFGIAIAAIAGYAAFDKNSQIHEMIAAQNMPVLMIGLYILLAVGIVLALIAFFGIWGTLAENRCLLFIYFVFILIIFGLQLAGVIITFIEFKKVEAYLIDDLKKPLPKNDNNTAAVLLSAVVRAGLEDAEKKFHCCGITGPDNYPTGKIPITCYAPLPKSRRKRSGNEDPAAAIEATTPVTTTTTQPAPTTTPKHGALYKLGCVTVAQPYLYAAGGIAIAILALEALVLLFTCCLMSEIKDDYTPV